MASGGTGIALGGARKRPDENAFPAARSLKLLAPVRCRPDAQGNWTGFDTDFCRALAAAIFDDPKKVQLISLSIKDRLTAPERQAYSYDGNGTFEGALAYDHLGPDARQRLLPPYGDG